MPGQPHTTAPANCFIVLPNLRYKIGVTQKIFSGTYCNYMCLVYGKMQLLVLMPVLRTFAVIF